MIRSIRNMKMKVHNLTLSHRSIFCKTDKIPTNFTILFYLEVRI